MLGLASLGAIPRPKPLFSSAYPTPYPPAAAFLVAYASIPPVPEPYLTEDPTLPPIPPFPYIPYTVL